MLSLTLTPTFNSVEVKLSCVRDAGNRITDVALTDAPASSLLRAIGFPEKSFVLSCPGSPWPVDDAVLEVCLQNSPGPARGFFGFGWPRKQSGSDSEQQVIRLSVSEPECGFHVLDANTSYVLSAKLILSNQSESGHPSTSDAVPGDLVAAEDGKVGMVCLDGSQHALEVIGIEAGQAQVRKVAVPTHASPLRRGVVVAANVQTLRGHKGLRVTPSLLMPRDQLGDWLLRLPGNYAYAASLDKDFVVKLFQHGLFVLPGDQQIFACPLPTTPYVFYLQDIVSNGTASTDGAPKHHAWGRSKMLRRYRNDFEFTCNTKFVEHLRLCASFHEQRGGTWLNEDLIALLVDIDQDKSNQISMYCFELWDKKTKNLVAASFGFGCGGFFHDFSMMCFERDKRTSGAILTKAIGSLLTAAGVLVWYWGCKSSYMAEYDTNGGQEVPRAEYYRQIRHASTQSLRCDPVQLIREGQAEIAPREDFKNTTHG